jgi:hypothetical protein
MTFILVRERGLTWILVAVDALGKGVTGEWLGWL